MKKLAILAVAMAGISQLCFAGAVCVSGTLSSYLTLGNGGCTIGSDTLSNFQLLAGTAGATEISALDVLLSPLSSPGNPGLTTTIDAMSSAGNIQELLFTYQISGTTYTGSSLTLSNSSETGDGAVTGILNFCAGGAFMGMDGVSGCTGTAGGLVTVDGAQNQDSAMFSGVNLLSIVNDLTVDGGLEGSASGGTLVNQFTNSSTAATPEPISLLLTGVGLGYVASRRYKLTRAGLVRKGKK